MIACMRTTIAAIAVAFMGSGIACADWQYTKWNMSPEQVVGASGGKAKAVSPIGRELDHLLLRGEEVIEGIKFASYFFFRERKLSAIELGLEHCTESQQRKIATLLVGRYGRPLLDQPEGASLTKTW
jgi:hypothetical protein